MLDGEVVTCAIHGKARSIRYMTEQHKGSYVCTSGSECKASGANGQLGDEPRYHCALHGKFRSMDCLVDDGTGSLVCIPDRRCKGGGQIQQQQQQQQTMQLPDFNGNPGDVDYLDHGESEALGFESSTALYAGHPAAAGYAQFSQPPQFSPAHYAAPGAGVAYGGMYPQYAWNPMYMQGMPQAPAYPLAANGTGDSLQLALLPKKSDSSQSSSSSGGKKKKDKKKKKAKRRKGKKEHKSKRRRKTKKKKHRKSKSSSSSTSSEKSKESGKKQAPCLALEDTKRPKADSSASSESSEKEEEDNDGKTQPASQRSTKASEDEERKPSELASIWIAHEGKLLDKAAELFKQKCLLKAKQKKTEATISFEALTRQIPDFPKREKKDSTFCVEKWGEDVGAEEWHYAYRGVSSPFSPSSQVPFAEVLEGMMLKFLDRLRPLGFHAISREEGTWKVSASWDAAEEAEQHSKKRKEATDSKQKKKKRKKGRIKSPSKSDRSAGSRSSDS